MKKTSLHILLLLLLAAFLLGGTVSSVYADSPSAVNTCISDGGTSVKSGSLQPQIAAKVVQKLQQLRLSAKVTAQSYGEVDSCGKYIPMGIDFTVTLPTTRLTSQAARQQTAKTILPVLRTLGKPNLGNVILIDSSGKASSVNTDQPSQQPQRLHAEDIPADAVFKKVYVIVYDPLLGNGQRLSEYEGWNDYTTLTQQTIDFFKDTSANKLNYSVVDTTLVTDEWPQKKDGFVYTEATYLSALNGQTAPHSPDEVNYTKIVNSTRFDICGRVNRGEIDEVWIYNAPNFGFYESRLAGPGAYNFNALPVTGSVTCNRLVPIMGPNVQRPVKEAIHNFMHRTESTLAKVYGSWDQNSTLHSWNQFSLVKLLSPSYTYSGCGNTHYPPNSTAIYDYGNTLNSIPSNCADFANFPNLGNPLSVAQPVTCTDWGCSDWENANTGYFHYWFSHIPSNSGCTGGVDNDWWDYIASPYLALYPANACQPDMHIISGTVSSSTTQTNNITVMYTDGTPKTVTSDGTGNYFLMVSNHWSGTVSPVKEGGYSVNPVNTSYSDVQSDQYNQNYTMAFDGPEIDIKGGGVSIPDGNSIPTPGNQTDFGVTQSASGTLSRTFTIYNTGPGILNLTGSPAVVISGANADEFSVTAQPASTIAPSSSTTFTVAFVPNASGVRTASVAIANNDWTESAYDFAIQGEADLNEMEVRGKDNTLILDIESTTSSFTGTDFGTTAITGGTVSHTFTINNTGYANLNLSGSPIVSISGTNPGDFSVTAQPTNSVTPSGSTSFTIVFDPTAAGRRVALISIANDDVDENPYGFLISGDGKGYPEMDVLGNSISIPDGTATTSASNDTDFGNVSVPDGTTISHTFTIANIGDGDLWLTGATTVAISGANAADFILTNEPNTLSSAGQSTTFTISFKPGAVGLRSAALSIQNTDSNENPYNFSLQGFGLGPGPSVASIALAGPSPSNAATVDFTVNFSEPVSGVDVDDFALTTNGLTGASVTSVSAFDAATYIVTANTGSGAGSLRLDVIDDDSIQNDVSQHLGGTGTGNGNFTSGPSYSIDRKAPTVLSSLRADTSPSSLSGVHFTVHFSEAVTGVDKTDFNLTTSGVTGASVANVAGTGDTYNVTVNTGTGNSGTIRLNVLANGTIIDVLGNPLNGAFNGGQSYAINKLMSLTLNSIAAQDGWVRESKETSVVGGAVNSNGTTFQLGDDTSNRQYRAILSFDTSTLPDNASIQSATLKIKQSGVPIGSNPFKVLGNLLLQIKTGSFGTTALQLSDFNAAASADLGAFNATPVSGWYSKALNAPSFIKINKVGPTQFRLYFSKDDNNNKLADYMNFVSGNATSGQPQLILTYTMP